ncbi:restriction endonuclease [Massilia sp. CMS3.1]|uniref:restriction endonuclease n=1 Tax=Massilia sp. CMS3.1 TaxID=3373083 RepID=UPI003EE5C654
MARKKKSSSADDIIALAALMPWWLAVALAFAAYAMLHGYATAPVDVISAKPGDMGRLVTSQMLRTGAMVGQYLLPVLLLLGALSSVIVRRRSKTLLATAATGDQADALQAMHAMSWQEFEQIVGQHFRSQGYSVTEHGGPGPDGGIDLALEKGGERFLVQCKQWRAVKVGVTIVRELYGVMASQGATGGFVISAGAFTADAQAFSSGRNIELIDGGQLARLMRGSGPEIAPRAHPATAAQPSPGGVKACPLCGNHMVVRTAKRGGNTGQNFWGCKRYPACRGTLSY